MTNLKTKDDKISLNVKFDSFKNKILWIFNNVLKTKD